MDKAILQDARKYVYDYLTEHLPAEYTFHDYDHAEEVAEISGLLAKKAELASEEALLLRLAAWFHDVGYSEGAEGHEERSAAVARRFMAEKGLKEEQIQAVEQLIRSTRHDHIPDTIPEKILHDANCSFLGRKRFGRRGQLLRLEEERVSGEQYSLLEWNRKLLDLQMSTKFHTIWAQEAFSRRKNKNIAGHKENLTKARKMSIRKKTGKEFGRGVDTIYRVTLRNHINLSSIADGKANMIISINTLVLSILITAASAGFSLSQQAIGDNLKFIVPVLLLMLTSLTAISFAVFSAMPKVSGQEFTPEDVREHRVSLLYFGNFLKIPKDEFVGYLRDLKEDQAILYDDLSRDLYNLGEVLQKKYRLLTYAYRVFVGGLALSFFAFLIAFLLL
ncbi:MAG: HD domain-containing protein [Lewinellaceae bacterium]|nr:HD domain-containing protein [Phaeodactylibacter sp.]MCB9041373.1 HD domain-containing protein [Lewinellaceae bacterium]